jgi:hypothetical protein
VIVTVKLLFVALTYLIPQLSVVQCHLYPVKGQLSSCASPP